MKTGQKCLHGIHFLKKKWKIKPFPQLLQTTLFPKPKRSKKTTFTINAGRAAAHCFRLSLDRKDLQVQKPECCTAYNEDQTECNHLHFICLQVLVKCLFFRKSVIGYSANLYEIGNLCTAFD